MRVLQTSTGRFMDVHEAVEAKIDDTFSDDSLRRMSERTEKTGEILGRLIEMLHDKDMLSEEQVLHIIGYGFE